MRMPPQPHQVLGFHGAMHPRRAIAAPAPAEPPPIEPGAVLDDDALERHWCATTAPAELEPPHPAWRTAFNSGPAIGIVLTMAIFGAVSLAAVIAWRWPA